jgi:hypothetical protein
MSPPPGYVAYGGSGAYDGSTFRSVRRLAKSIVILLWIALPLQLLGLIDVLRLSSQAKKLLDGSISEQSFEDSTRAGFSLGVVLMAVPIAVLTMIWMYRMSSNLRLLGRVGQTWVPGWAIGAWFVPPCVAYVVPWLMFKELWRGSDPEVAPGDVNWKQRPVRPLITVWWVLYGLVPILSFSSNVQFINEVRSDTITTRELAQSYRDYAATSVVYAVIAMAATVVYLMLVRDLSSRHMQATREA